MRGCLFGVSRIFHLPGGGGPGARGRAGPLINTQGSAESLQASRCDVLRLDRGQRPLAVGNMSRIVPAVPLRCAWAALVTPEITTVVPPSQRAGRRLDLCRETAMSQRKAQNLRTRSGWRARHVERVRELASRPCIDPWQGEQYHSARSSRRSACGMIRSRHASSSATAEKCGARATHAGSSAATAGRCCCSASRKRRSLKQTSPHRGA